MKCEDARPLVSASMDTELTLGESRALTEHLSVCHECTAYRDTLIECQDALRGHLSLRAPDEFEAAILNAMNSMPAETAERRSVIDVIVDYMRPGWRQVLASSVAAIALALGLLTASGIAPWRDSGQDLQRAREQMYMRITQDDFPELIDQQDPSSQQPTKSSDREHDDRNGATRWFDVTHTS